MADRPSAPERTVAVAPWRDPPSLRSFWMGGFEGADHLNRHGEPLDMRRAAGHDDRLDEDFALVASLGIRAVRESVGWRLCETAPGRFDFRRVEAIARTASRHGVQVLWTLMHYGIPPDLDYFDDALIDRFAAFAGAAARALGAYADAPPIYTPVNEIGFVSWAVSETDLMRHGRMPRETHTEGSLASGYEVKRRLARAALAGIEMIRRVDSGARFLHVEPLVHVVAPRDRPELAAIAERVSAYQWQAWDLLSGACEPALGGTEGALDLIGINYYHSGQWEVETEQRLWWHEADARRRPFADLLGDAWRRYGHPMVVAETSHFGDGRVAWLDDIGREVLRARHGGVPVEAVCLYPVVDRPDWNDSAHWHHSGLVDVVPPAAGGGSSGAHTAYARHLNLDYANALSRWQSALPEKRPPASTLDREAASPKIAAAA